MFAIIYFLHFFNPLPFSSDRRIRYLEVRIFYLPFHKILFVPFLKVFASIQVEWEQQWTKEKILSFFRSLERKLIHNIFSYLSQDFNYMMPFSGRRDSVCQNLFVKKSTFKFSLCKTRVNFSNLIVLWLFWHNFYSVIA